MGAGYRVSNGVAGSKTSPCGGTPGSIDHASSLLMLDGISLDVDGPASCPAKESVADPRNIT
jgi:hypothetical protein